MPAAVSRQTRLSKLVPATAQSKGVKSVYYLYGSQASARKLVATFDSEQQLLAYVRWATLSEHAGSFKFEQGSPLVGYHGWDYSDSPQSEEDPAAVVHNPTPSML
jgi:hypothetical protein